MPQGVIAAPATNSPPRSVVAGASFFLALLLRGTLYVASATAAVGNAMAFQQQLPTLQNDH